MAYAQAVAASPSNINVAGPASATFDGITVANGNRVLLTNQTAGKENGVWIFNGAGNAMTRPVAPDQYKTGNTFDNATLIWVTGGNTLAGTAWGLDPAGVVTVDTTAHSLTKVALPPVQVRAASTANVPLGSTTTTLDGVTLTGNGLAGSDIILLKNQITASENGLYWANTGGALTSARASEPLAPNRAVIVGGEGLANAHAQFVLPEAGNTITLGTTALAFSRQNVLNVRDFGALGDGRRVTDATINSGSTTLLSSTANWTSADVGKLITVYGAGSSGGVLSTTIFSRGSATQVTLLAAASTTVGALSGTVSVQNGMKSITFSTAQTIDTSAAIVFASQPGQSYSLASPLVAGTAATLATAYTGTTNAATTTTTTEVARWGSDDRAAIVATIQTAIASTGTSTGATEVYFPPGEYCVSAGIQVTAAYTGLSFRGAACGPTTGAAALTISRILLMSPASYLIQNTTQNVRWRDLWFSGNRLATDTMQFEYFGASQTFWNCNFDGCTASGNVHHYGTLNGALEIDFISFHDCGLAGDFLDSAYLAGSCVYNENTNALMIDYHDGVAKNAATIFNYFGGSCNVKGTQCFRWTTACIYIQTSCQPCVFEGLYNEQDTAPFLDQVANVAQTSSFTLTLRNCQLSGNTQISWAHTMCLRLESVVINANIFSNPAAAIAANGVAYGVQRIVSVDTTFLNGYDFVYSSGVAGQLVDEISTAISQLAQTTVTDGAMTAASTVLTCATSHPFTLQSVGMPVSIAGAGPSGATLNTWIKDLVLMHTTTEVDVVTAASTTVTNASVSFGVQNLASSRVVSPSEIVHTHTTGTDYDADGVYLAIGRCIVGAGVPVVPGDLHIVSPLTANRSYQLSTLYVTDFGNKMRVSRVPATDAFTATINYNSATQSIVLAAGQWADFSYLPSLGWMLVASGGPSMQSGSHALASGTFTISAGITITASSKVFLTRTAVGGTVTSTVMYEAPSASMVTGGPGTGSFKVNAVTSAHSVNTSDASTIGYLIVG